MRIAFLLPNFSGGGIARVAAMLSNEWATLGHDVHVATFEHQGAESAYPLDPAIGRHFLGGDRANVSALKFLSVNARRAFRAYRFLERTRPDVLVTHSTEAGIIGTLAGAVGQVPVIIYEANNPTLHREGWKREVLRKVCFKLGRTCVVQTRIAADWYRSHLGIEARIVANPIDLRVFGRPRDAVAQNTIIAVGRLEHQKGFDLLLDAVAALPSSYDDWTLTILGEGSCRPQLEDKIRELALADRVFLPGAVRDVGDWLSKAEIYVHPARFEGLPNSMLEAMASGVCVVATPCGGVSAEVLESGKCGIVCDSTDAVALTRALQAAMDNPMVRSERGALAQAAVRKFSTANVAEIWIEIFQQCSERVSNYTRSVAQP